MAETNCSNCDKPLKRHFGILTIIAVLLTSGLWLIALPFYTKKCPACETSTSNNTSEAITGSNWYKKWQIWAFLVMFLGIGTLGYNERKNPPPPKTPEQIAADQTFSDGIDARSWAEIYVKKSLKAPSTAKFPNRLDYKYAQGKDKKGKKIKDVWEVSSYVDAQNSFGAMLRQNWYVKLKKEGDSWRLLDVQMWE